MGKLCPTKLWGRIELGIEMTMFYLKIAMAYLDIITV
ncbi:Transposase [Vibrio ordalii]|jgi:hypothetical protein